MNPKFHIKLLVLQPPLFIWLMLFRETSGWFVYSTSYSADNSNCIQTYNPPPLRVHKAKPSGSLVAQSPWKWRENTVVLSGVFHVHQWRHDSCQALPFISVGQEHFLMNCSFQKKNYKISQKENVETFNGLRGVLAFPCPLEWWCCLNLLNHADF